MIDSNENTPIGSPDTAAPSERDILSSLSYKEILVSELQRLREEGRKLNLANMAKHCRVQRSYLSRVIHREGNLSDDQLFLAAKYLGLTDLETEFVLALKALEDSQVEERREFLRAVIARLKEKHREMNTNPV